MFSENERISGRQLYRSIVLTMAGPTLLICPRVAGRYGGDGFFVYGVAGLLSVAYIFLVLYLRKLLGRYGRNGYSASNGDVSRILRGALHGLVVGKLLLLSVGGLYLICDVVTGILLPGTHIVMVLLVLICGLIYWHQGSIECSARAFEMLFYWVVIPVIIVVAFAVPKVGVNNLVPQLDASFWDIILSGVFLWFLFAPAELLIIGGEHFGRSEDKNVGKSVWKALITLFVGNLVAYGTILGIYGKTTICDGSPYPLLKVMQISGIPGDFLRRLDGFMSVFLILSLFCAMVMLMDFMGINVWEIGNLLRGDKGNRKNKGNNGKCKLIFSIIVVIIMAGATLILREQNIFRQPATGRSEAYADKKIVSGVELEERAFVMSVIVGDKTVTFEIASDEEGKWQDESQYVTIPCSTVSEAELLYRKNGDKRLDFTHLKLIILEKKDMTSPILRENIEYMYIQEKYAENVLVCYLEGELIEMTVNAMEKGEALAVRLESIIENRDDDVELELYEVYGKIKGLILSE